MSKTASIILSIVLSALIVGTGVYFITNKAAQTEIDELEFQVEELQTQVEQLQREEQEQPTNEDQTSEDETTFNPLTISQLKNTSYTIEDTFYSVNPQKPKESKEVNFFLSNGKYEYDCLNSGAKDCTIQIMDSDDNYEIENIVGDKSKDGIVILQTNDGGTAVYEHLAVIENNEGDPKFFDSYYIGNIAVEHVDINKEKIIVQAKTYAEDDPNCCPSVDKTFEFEIDDNKIKEITN